MRALERVMKKSLGIYIHIPFCLQKCRYCDFCSLAGKDRDYMSAYADELCRRISEFAPKTESYVVDTVYFGGGTPSLLPAEDIRKIMNALALYDVSPDAEVTLECNPATADLEYFKAVRNLGVNRLSIGLQSAHDRELALLGRVHSVDDFVTCFEDARRAGFDNISADLMYGIPDQTLESFAKSIDFLVSLKPEHISSYGLTVEEGTYFHKHESELDLADSDTQAEMYCMMEELLARRGYGKYEISNFSRAGRQSKHNLRYWKRLDYVGFGVAAHSCFDGIRYGNSRDISAFLNVEDITEEKYVLEKNDIKSEYVMLGLRLTEGIDMDDYSSLFGEELLERHPVIYRYVGDGFMRFDGNRVCFTQKGMLVSNSILSDIL